MIKCSLGPVSLRGILQATGGARSPLVRGIYLSVLLCYGPHSYPFTYEDVKLQVKTRGHNGSQVHTSAIMIIKIFILKNLLWRVALTAHTCS